MKRIALILMFTLAASAQPAALETEADRLAREGKFSGVVLVTENARPVVRRAWGARRATEPSSAGAGPSAT